jgi:GNAT superfamily N-acetyltransferase
MPIVSVVRKTLDVEIRPLSEGDYPALAAELGRSHAKYFRRRLPLQTAGKGMIPVAFRKGRPVGAALVLWAEPPEERRLRLRLPGVPLLYHVFVKEDLRCRGIGTQLLARVHDELRAQGHQQVTLGVDHSNKDARRLYERLGYDNWEEEGWGGDKKRSTGYEAMVLDLDSNDRTEFLGLATSRHEPQPVHLSKQQLDTVIAEVLGKVSDTVNAVPSAKKTSPPPRPKSKHPKPPAGERPVTECPPGPKVEKSWYSRFTGSIGKKSFLTTSRTQRKEDVAGVR